MPIVLPSYVAPNELIQSSWGNAVVDGLADLDNVKANRTGANISGFFTFTELTSGVVLPSNAPAGSTHATPKSYVDAQDDDRVAVTGDGMTGTLTIAGTGQIRIRPTNNLPILDMYAADATTRYGVLSATSTLMRLASDNDVVIQSGSNEIVRGTASVAMFGKTASSLNTAGTEIFTTGSSVVGSIRTTTDDDGFQNVYCRHMSAADANDEMFIEFTRTSAGTSLGAINQNLTTGVTYDSASDARLKNVLYELDDDDIAEVLRKVAPVVFEFISEPGVEQVGFLAQQLAEAWPAAIDSGCVRPGRGEPGDDDFRPWMVDHSRITPLLVAGWQQLDRRLTALEDQS